MDQHAEARTLETLRQRLVTVTAATKNLHDQMRPAMEGRGPLPRWSEIHAAQRTIALQIKAIQEIMADADKGDLLRAAHPYPTSQFPWHQNNIIHMLLRKRLEPNVEKLAAQAKAECRKLEATEGMEPEDWDELWEWGAIEANGIARDVLSMESDDEAKAEASEAVDSDAAWAAMTRNMKFATQGKAPP